MKDGSLLSVDTNPPATWPISDSASPATRSKKCH